MAVVCCNQYGWVVDHKYAIDRSLMYKCLDQGTETRILNNPTYAFKDALFDIKSPFMMDSQYSALKSNLKASLDVEQSQKRRHRKRKRKSEVNHGEMKANEYHNSVKESLMTAYCELVDSAKKIGFFASSDYDYSGDNNKRARMLAKDLEDVDVKGYGVDVSLCATVDFQSSICVDEKDNWEGEEIVNRLVTNSKAREITVEGLQYVLPACASFVMSDFSQLIRCQAQILKEQGEFDLIVIDPPWQNKSIKRQKRYHTLCNNDLLKLPVPDLIRMDGLVAVWVTNRWQHIEFIKETLFPRWSLQYEATWHWIKVTKAGQMVYNFDSEHKKPYEIIIFGRRKPVLKLCVKAQNNLDSKGKVDETKQNWTETNETVQGSCFDIDTMCCLKKDKTTRSSNIYEKCANSTEVKHMYSGKMNEIDLCANSSDEIIPCSDVTNEKTQNKYTANDHSLYSNCAGNTNLLAVNETIECPDPSCEITQCSYTRNETVKDSNANMETIHCSITNNETVQCANSDDTSQCPAVGTSCLEQLPLPEHKVIISIPCSIHSMKPPFQDILKQFLRPNAKCLELFARNLWPGWTSWGNEVLKHQSLKYFDKVKE